MHVIALRNYFQLLEKLCRTPEEEDVEVHPDGIALLADADGLQDARVPQLTADQLVLKHGSLLKKKKKKKKM